MRTQDLRLRLALPLLVVLRMGCFTYNGVLAPLMPEMSRDLHFSLAMTAQFAAATALAWGLGGVVLTPLVTRFGAKRLIIVGSLLMALFSILTATTSSYAVLLLTRLFGGFAGGSVGPSSQVYVMEAYEGRAQTAAIGWVAAGYSMGGLIMVPALVLLAAYTGWRGALIGVGVFFVAAAAFMSWVPTPKAASALQSAKLPDYRGTLTLVFRSPGALRALVANFLERSANQAVVTFLPVLLLLRYHLAYTQVAPVLSAFSGAAVLGALIGGSWPRGLEGETRSRRAYFWGLLPAIPIAGVLFTWAAGFWTVVALSIAYALVDAYVRPIYLKLIGSVTTPGATLGWNALGNQLGGMFGTSIPSFLIGEAGFAALGVWSAVLTAVAALTMLRPPRPRPVATQFYNAP